MPETLSVNLEADFLLNEFPSAAAVNLQINGGGMLENQRLLAVREKGNVVVYTGRGVFTMEYMNVQFQSESKGFRIKDGVSNTDIYVERVARGW